MTTPNTPTITVDNISEVIKEMDDITNVSQKAKAWEVVFRFCIQNGMDKSQYPTGIQNVIHFIGNLVKNQE